MSNRWRRDRFARVEVIVELLQSDVEMVENMALHHHVGGKRMRPLLVLLSAKALGGIEDAHPLCGGGGVYSRCTCRMTMWSTCPP